VGVLVEWYFRYVQSLLRFPRFLVIAAQLLNILAAYTFCVVPKVSFKYIIEILFIINLSV
jgi:hypothetical protein